jgi:hypothetical protein
MKNRITFIMLSPVLITSLALLSPAGTQADTDTGIDDDCDSLSEGDDSYDGQSEIDDEYDGQSETDSDSETDDDSDGGTDTEADCWDDDAPLTWMYPRSSVNPGYEFPWPLTPPYDGVMASLGFTTRDTTNESLSAPLPSDQCGLKSIYVRDEDGVTVFMWTDTDDSTECPLEKAYWVPVYAELPPTPAPGTSAVNKVTYTTEVWDCANNCAESTWYYGVRVTVDLQGNPRITTGFNTINMDQPCSDC